MFSKKLHFKAGGLYLGMKQSPQLAGIWLLLFAIANVGQINIKLVMILRCTLYPKDAPMAVIFYSRQHYPVINISVTTSD